MPKRNRNTVQQSSVQKRLRAYAACNECRRRKRKCDGREPCSSCHGHGYSCTYNHGTAAVPNAGNEEETSQIHGHHSPVAGNRQRASRSPSQSKPALHRKDVLVSKQKRRLFNAHSTVALPHIVGSELDARPPPRLHSFAWNLGVRPERRPAIGTNLSSLITLEDCQRLSSVYFTAAHPMFAFLPPATFLGRLQANWDSLETQPNFTAVVAAVAALGSYFAKPDHNRLQQEEKLASYSFSILDLALSTPIALIDLNAVSGWILRAIYVRLTTRPAVASLASQTAMHMAEIIGLHREIPDGKTDSSSKIDVLLFNEAEREVRRRHFWAALFLNRLLSVDYGLSSVNLSHMTCLVPTPTNDGVHIGQLVSLAQILDSVDVEAKKGLHSQCMNDLMMRLQNIPDDDAPVVSLFKAEVCLGMLRRFISASMKPAEALKASSILAIQKSLDQIPTLLTMRYLWWNLLSVPFQTVCVCLYIDDSAFLTLLPVAMDLLRSIADSLDSHLAREAVDTAQQLISLSRDKTNAKLELKNSALGDLQPNLELNWPSYDPILGMEDWPSSLDFLYNTQ